jgi:hypothetical protein
MDGTHHRLGEKIRVSTNSPVRVDLYSTYKDFTQVLNAIILDFRLLIEDWTARVDLRFQSSINNLKSSMYGQVQ